MVEKILGNVPDIYEINQTAAKLRQLGMREELQKLAEKYAVTMTQIALAWQFAKGVASPIIGATKARYFDDAVGAFNVNLTQEDISYLEELYVPHKIVGAL